MCAHDWQEYTCCRESKNTLRDGSSGSQGALISRIAYDSVTHKSRWYVCNVQNFALQMPPPTHKVLMVLHVYVHDKALQNAAPLIMHTKLQPSYRLSDLYL